MKTTRHHHGIRTSLFLSAFAWLLAVVPASAQDVDEIRGAAQRGLTFLETDVQKWRAEHECATCHHGTMTVWAFSEAAKHGLQIAPDTSAEILTWSKARFMERMDQPRDTRDGWSMVSSPGIYLSVIAQCVDGQYAITPDDLAMIDRHLMRHQEENGSWAWSSAPPGNRPPPFFESDEVATRLTLIGLEGRDKLDPDQAAAIQASQERAKMWLANAVPEATTQATAIRLLMHVRQKASPDVIHVGTQELIEQRNEDGGWGQLPDLPSDAYATGQSLYVLEQAGLTSERDEIRSAIQVLITAQNEDGSWPMSSRSHPGAEPFKNPVPITYFGSAWGTLGLLSALPEADDHE